MLQIVRIPKNLFQFKEKLLKVYVDITLHYIQSELFDVTCSLWKKWNSKEKCVDVDFCGHDSVNFHSIFIKFISLKNLRRHKSQN